VADSSERPRDSALSVLFRAERRLGQRLQGVIRFDPAIYREIQADVHAIPQSIAVVVATSLLAGLGRQANLLDAHADSSRPGGGSSSRQK
jgi:hypothetical protein